MLKHWIYDGNPIEVLPFSPLLREIKEDIKSMLQFCVMFTIVDCMVI